MTPQPQPKKKPFFGIWLQELITSRAIKEQIAKTNLKARKKGPFPPQFQATHPGNALQQQKQEEFYQGGQCKVGTLEAPSISSCTRKRDAFVEKTGI